MKKILFSFYLSIFLILNINSIFKNDFFVPITSAVTIFFMKYSREINNMDKIQQCLKKINYYGVILKNNNQYSNKDENKDNMADFLINKDLNVNKFNDQKSFEILKNYFSYIVNKKEEIELNKNLLLNLINLNNRVNFKSSNKKLILSILFISILSYFKLLKKYFYHDDLIYCTSAILLGGFFPYSNILDFSDPKNQSYKDTIDFLKNKLKELEKIEKIEKNKK